MQAWQVPHPPKRGSGFCNDRPAVHKGFLESYLANGFNQRIIDRVADIVASHEWACTKVKPLACTSLIVPRLKQSLLKLAKLPACW